MNYGIGSPPKKNVQQNSGGREVDGLTDIQESYRYLEKIQTRRTVRNFSDHVVDFQIIENAIRSAA